MKKTEVLVDLKDYVDFTSGIVFSMRKYWEKKRWKYKGLEEEDKRRKQFYKDLEYNVVMGFGKYKGKPIHEVPDTYRSWAWETWNKEVSKHEFALPKIRRKL